MYTFNLLPVLALVAFPLSTAYLHTQYNTLTPRYAEAYPEAYAKAHATPSLDPYHDDYAIGDYLRRRSPLNLPDNSFLDGLLYNRAALAPLASRDDREALRLKPRGKDALPRNWALYARGFDALAQPKVKRVEQQWDMSEKQQMGGSKTHAGEQPKAPAVEAKPPAVEANTPAVEAKPPAKKDGSAWGRMAERVHNNDPQPNRIGLW